MRTGSVRTITLGAAATLIASANTRRAILLVSPPLPADHDENLPSISVGVDPNLEFDSGVVIAAGSDAMKLTREEFGDLVVSAWYAVEATGTVSKVNVIEVFDGC